MEDLNLYVDRIEHSMAIAARKVVGELTHHKELGLTGPQFHLMSLIERETVSNVKFLAHEMKVNPSAVTVMINRLVQSGFVSRLQDEYDRRAVVLSLTKEGEKVVKMGHQLTRDMLTKYLSVLEPDELQLFVTIIEKIAHKYQG